MLTFCEQKDMNDALNVVSSNIREWR